MAVVQQVGHEVDELRQLSLFQVFPEHIGVVEVVAASFVGVDGLERDKREVLADVRCVDRLGR
jgi:hypothetical protein